MAHIEQHIPTLRNIAVELRNRFPRESLSELTSTDPQAWAKESFDIAAKIAYQNGALRGTPKGQRTDCREVRDAAVLPAGYARVARKIADRRRMLARYHLASLLAFLVRTSGTRPYKRFKMAVFLHDRLRRNIYRRKLLQRARPIPRKSMDRQVCASYICFLIYLVAHRKARISRPA